MKCPEALDLLPWVCLGEAEPQARAGVSRHLADCPDCRAESDRLLALLGRVAGSEVPDPGPAYWQAFLPRLRRRITGRPAPWARTRWVALAASLAVCLLAATLVGGWNPPPDRLAAARLDRFAVRAGPAEMRRVLEDVFPDLGPSLPEDDAHESIPNPASLQEALDTLLPEADRDIYTQMEQLSPEARKWLARRLQPGRG